MSLLYLPLFGGDLAGDSLECFPLLPRLALDRQLLRYIYRNAVSNACKYGKPDGLLIPGFFTTKGRDV
jgi:signal transduction histidine kinase